jgi:recombination endonuclease VII
LRRHYKLITRYGIGLGEVERMIEEQGGVCAICRSAAPRDVDHDHETGEVRGILCSPCNSGMGLFKDNARRLRDAAAYLEGAMATPNTYLVLRSSLMRQGRAPGLRPQASRLEGLMAEMIRESGAN